jgi:hypothetical protein
MSFLLLVLSDHSDTEEGMGRKQTGVRRAEPVQRIVKGETVHLTPSFREETS